MWPRRAQRSSKPRRRAARRRQHLGRASSGGNVQAAMGDVVSVPAPILLTGRAAFRAGVGAGARAARAAARRGPAPRSHRRLRPRLRAGGQPDPAARRPLAAERSDGALRECAAGVVHHGRARSSTPGWWRRCPARISTASRFRPTPGATQKAIATGVPVCAVPFGREQLEVARRVEVSGAGSRLPARRLNPATSEGARAIACRPGADRIASVFSSGGGATAAAGG